MISCVLDPYGELALRRSQKSKVEVEDIFLVGGRAREPRGLVVVPSAITFTRGGRVSGASRLGLALRLRPPVLSGSATREVASISTV